MGGIKASKIMELVLPGAVVERTAKKITRMGNAQREGILELEYFDFL